MASYLRRPQTTRPQSLLQATRRNRRPKKATWQINRKRALGAIAPKAFLYLK